MTTTEPPLKLDRTPERITALAEYIRKVRDALHLQAWRINVEHREVEGADTYLARIDPMAGTWTALLWVADTYWNRDAEQRRDTVTHELLHLYHRDVSDLIDDGKMIKEIMGTPAWSVLQETLHRELECMVDRLTSLVGPSMPMPADEGAA